MKNHDTGWTEARELAKLDKAAAKIRAQKVLKQNRTELAEAQDLL